MRRIVQTLAFLGLACLAGGAQAVGPHARDYSQIFDVYLGGVWVAEMKVDAKIGNDGYKAAAALETKGIVKTFYKWAFEAKAEGAVEGSRLATGTFVADTRSRKKNQFLEMRYTAGKPAALRAVPEFDPRPWEIDPTEQANTADPLSAALTALTPAPGTPICNQRVEIFDGRKRYAIILKEPEKKGALIRCRALYTRVAGYKPKFMAKPDIPFEFWFEPTEDGGHRILRAMGETPIGVAVIRQRKG